jgi:mono/diheme cytochrome c family protein
MRFSFEGLLKAALLAAVTFALTGPGFSAATADQGTKDAQYVKNGRALFVQYCVSCHGSSGIGDGPVAPALKVAPDDLTGISRKYNGFPFDKILNEIDGEKASSAHGSREMPVWGKRFRDSKRGEAAGFGDLYALTKYLQSIQKP